MELLQLRYFYETSKNGSFAKTAEKYRVPPTSVSACVRRLEKELGCLLFDRESNKIVLNEKGRQMQQALHTVFFELDSVVEDISSDEEDVSEIKMLVRSLRHLVTSRIIEYKKINPHAVIKTVFDFEDTNYEDYDIIIDEENDCYSGYEKFELQNIRLKLKAATSLPLAGRPLTLKQLSKQPFVSMGEHSNMHKILLKACERAGFAPNIVVQTNDSACYDKLISAGIGIGISRVSNSVKTAILDVTDFDERQIIYAFYKKPSAYGTVKDFLDFLRKSAE